MSALGCVSWVSVSIGASFWAPGPLLPPPSAVSPSPRLCAPAGVPAPLFLPLARCTFRYVFAVCLSPNFFSLIHSLWQGRCLAPALFGPSILPLHPCLSACLSDSLFPSPPLWKMRSASLSLSAISLPTLLGFSLCLSPLSPPPGSQCWTSLPISLALVRGPAPLFSPRAACPVSCGLGPAQPLWAEQRRGLPQGICSQKPQTVSPGALWEPQGSVLSSSHTLLRDWVSRSFPRGPPHLTHLSQILRGCSDPLSSVSSERPGGQHCTEKTPDVFLACILSNSVNLKH